MKWAIETLDKLERKISSDVFTHEDYGCHCIAEPYKPEAEKITEYISQTLTSAAMDASHTWTLLDYHRHYYNENGKPTTLHEMGSCNRLSIKQN